MKLFQSFASRPLRFQIALVTGLTALVVAASVGIGAVVTSRAHTVKLISGDLSAVASSMADRVGRGVDSRLREMAFLAELEPIRDNARANPVVIRRVLELLQEGSSIYAWLGFADRNGRILAGTGGFLEGTSAKGKPWFDEGLLGSYVGDVYPAINLRQRVPGARAPQVFDVSQPIYGPDGELLGVLVAKVNWAWMATLRDAALSADLHPSTEILVLRRDGTALLGAPVGTRVLSEERADSAHEAGRGVSHEKESLNAFAVTRDRAGTDLGWIVITRQPLGIALADVTRMTWIIAVIGALAGLLGLLVGGPLALRLSRPLRALADEADRIGRDPHQGMLGLHRGSEEVERLSASLRSLLTRLGLEEQLRLQVEEEASRTTDQLVSDLRNLRDLADTDPLTGLRNRRSFIEAAEFSEGCVLVAIDIDRFKRVNDKYGHAAGDEVLKQIAYSIACGVRREDVAARFGGEEFVVLLREVSTRRAENLAERMRESIQSTVRLTDGKPVTVSLGVAAWHKGQSLDEALAAADRELYRAKSGGRNRVCVAGQERAA